MIENFDAGCRLSDRILKISELRIALRGVGVMKPARKETWIHKAERNAKFAELIRMARTESGFSQMDVARKISKPQSFVSNLENGRAHVTLVDFEQIAFAIGSDPVSLLSRLYRKPNRTG